MRAFTAALLTLVLAGCAGPDARPAPKRELTYADRIDECMHRFNACQTDMWCSQQPVCQQQNQQQQRQQQPGSTLPSVKVPRVP